MPLGQVEEVLDRMVDFPEHVRNLLLLDGEPSVEGVCKKKISLLRAGAATGRRRI